MLDQANCQPIKIWIDKGSEFYNRSMKLWLQDTDIEMYSSHNEAKSVAERFIRTLKKTKFIKNVYIVILVEINKFINTYHCTNKIKPVDVKSKTYIKFNVEKNNEDSKFNVGDHVKSQNIKTFLQKGYNPNSSEETVMIK